MTDPIEAATKFNEAVEATAVVGGLIQKVDAIDRRTVTMEKDVKHIRTTVDRYAGAMVLVGSLVSIAVSVVVALFK